jgi:hypothetical protein
MHRNAYEAYVDEVSSLGDCIWMSPGGSLNLWCRCLVALNEPRAFGWRAKVAGHCVATVRRCSLARHLLNVAAPLIELPLFGTNLVFDAVEILPPT